MSKRLTQSLRNDIIYEFKRKNIQPKIEIRKEKLTKLADEVYTKLYGDVEKLIEEANIPEEFFRKAEEFYLFIDEERYTYNLGGSYQSLNLSKPRVSKNGNFYNTLKITTSEAPDLVKKLKDFAKDNKLFVKKTNALIDTIHNRISGITTLKKLKDVWKEGFDLLPSEAKSEDSALPVVVDFKFVKEQLEELK